MIFRFGRREAKYPFHQQGSPCAARSGDSCTFCSTQVFTESLYERLLSSRSIGDQRPIASSYSCPIANLCISAESGCKWCSTLVGGILHADYFDFSSEIQGDACFNDGTNTGTTLFPYSQAANPPSVRLALTTAMKGLYHYTLKSLDRASKSKETNGKSEDDRRNKEAGHIGQLNAAKLKLYRGPVTVNLEFVKSIDEPTFAMLKVAISLSWEDNHLKSGLGSLPVWQDETAVSLKFELFGSNTSNPNVFTSRHEDLSLASAEHLDLARRWIIQCKEHDDCTSKKIFDVSDKPKRGDWIEEHLEESRKVIREYEHEETNSPTPDSQPVQSRDSASALPSRVSFAKFFIGMYEHLSRGTGTPRHLIDVTSKHASKVVQHKTLSQRARYVALSYVWGQNQSYV
jgi:hypothetical protein